MCKCVYCIYQQHTGKLENRKTFLRFHMNFHQVEMLELNERFIQVIFGISFPLIKSVEKKFPRISDMCNFCMVTKSQVRNPEFSRVSPCPMILI